MSFFEIEKNKTCTMKLFIDFSQNNTFDIYM